jgi:hypothetical protein
MNSRNKPNLVPADIKHGKTTHLVGARKNTFQPCEVAESCMLQNSVPGIQGGGTFRVLFSKIQYFFPCYDVHVFLISQYEISVKHVIQNNAIFRFYGSGVFKGPPILCHVLEWNLILHLINKQPHGPVRFRMMARGTDTGDAAAVQRIVVHRSDETDHTVGSQPGHGTHVVNGVGAAGSSPGTAICPSS